jgi:hypothetical protein
MDGKHPPDACVLTDQAVEAVAAFAIDWARRSASQPLAAGDRQVQNGRARNNGRRRAIAPAR